MARPPHDLQAHRIAELVQDGLPLVGHFVREMLTKVPTHVHRDQLTSAAMTGLTLAARGFDPARGVPFGSYAAIRIRGALIDELRGMDFGSRAVRGRAREMAAVNEQLTALLGRQPRRDEVAAAIGISVAELAALAADLVRARQVSLDGFAATFGPAPVERDAGPEALILLRERLGCLHDAIDALPRRLRFVITGYFFEQRQLADLAAELGVTPSRVSQMRAEALMLLRDGSNSRIEPAAEPDPVTKRGRSARQAHAAAVGRGTLRSRLARTTVRADECSELRQAVVSGCRTTPPSPPAWPSQAAGSPGVWRAPARAIT